MNNRQKKYQSGGIFKRSLKSALIAVLVMVFSMTFCTDAAAADIVIHAPVLGKNPLVIASVTVDGKETDYTKIEDAMNAAAGQNKPVIKLYKTVEVPYTWTFGSDQVGTTVDLNGYDIIRTGADKSKYGAVISIENGADVSFVNVYRNGGIKKGSSSNSAGGVQVNAGGKLRMENITISDIANDYEGAAICNEGGDVELNGVTIQNCSSESNGGAIYHKSGRMKISDCLIADNRTEGNGGGIAADGENVEIYNSKILRNFADDDGGGIWVNSDKVFIIGGEIKANMADYGGGVYVDSMHDVNIQGKLIITENQTTSSETSNLVLQDGLASDANAYDGGLLPGSKVGINKTKDLGGGFRSVIGATDYELANGYYVADRGRLELRDTSKKIEVFMATAIDNYGWGIVLLLVLELMGAGYVIVDAKRKQRKNNNNNNTKKIVKKALSLFLALVLFAELPMGEYKPANAAPTTDVTDEKTDKNDDTKTTVNGQYISDIRLFKTSGGNRDSVIASAEKDGWTIAKKGEVPVNLNEYTERDDIILGYKTSSNENDAITDIRMLEMGHGYEWFDYQKIAESQMDNLGGLAADVGVASVEFSNNLSAGSKAAQYAKDYLNYLYYTDSTAKDAEKDRSERHNLGDYFSSGKVDQKLIKKMIIRMNGGSLTALYSQLALAVSDTDKNWVERIAETTPYNNTEKSSDEAKIMDRAYYEYAVELAELLKDFASGYKKASSHKKGEEVALPSVSGTAADVELDPDNVQDVIDAGNTDKNSSDLLYEVAYGILEKYTVGSENAAEYMMNLAEKSYTSKTDYRVLYPLVAALTDGQYGMMKVVGFAQMVLNLNRTDEFYAKLDEMRSEVLDGIHKVTPGEDQMSIWAGVNTEFYEHKVALTEDAYRESKAGTLYTELTRQGEFYDNMNLAMTYIGLAGSVSSLITGCISLGIYIAGAKLSVWAVCAGAVGGGIFSTIGGILGCVAVIAGYAVLAALIVAGIVYFVKWIVEQVSDPDKEDYLQMPTEIYDLAQVEVNNEKRASYIKYEAVTNSDGKPQDLNADDGKRWNLLYYSKSKSIGSPLMTASDGRAFVRTVDSANAPKGAVSVKCFGEKTASNLNSYTRKKGANSLYLHFSTKASLEKSGGVLSEDESVNVGDKVEVTDSIDENEYLFAIMVSHEDSESAAKAAITRKQGYKVYDVNLSNGNGYTYIGFATTEVESDAIRDIRFVPHATGERLFGSNSYSFGGKLDDGTGILYSKYKNAGNPVYAGFLSSKELLPPESGYEPINLFSGGNAYDINFQTEDRDPLYLYFRATKSYVSGEKYISGIQYINVRKGKENKTADEYIKEAGLIDFGVDIVDHKITGLKDKHGYTAKGARASQVIVTGIYYYELSKIRLCYSYTYNPYRAIYDVGVYTATQRLESLNSTITSKEGTYAVADTLMYSDVASLYADWDLSGKSEKPASTKPIGLVSKTNSYMFPPKSYGYRSVYTHVDVEDNVSWTDSAERLQGLYLLGPVADKDPLKISDVQVSNSPDGIAGMHSVKRFTDPYSKPVDISYVDGLQTTKVYMYLTGAEQQKPKYISSIEVVKYKRPANTEKHTFTEEEYAAYDIGSDDTCRMELASKADGGIYNYNLAIPQSQAWYNNRNASNTIATYIGVNRTDSENHAITGIIFLKASEKPEAKIKINGAEYHRTGDPVNGYYLYYTKSPGANPGLPVTDLVLNEEPITKGTSTAVGVSSPDENGKNAEFLTDLSGLNLYIHTKHETKDAIISDMALYRPSNKLELMTMMIKNGFNYVVNESFNYGTGGDPIYLVYKMCSADAVSQTSEEATDDEDVSEFGEDEDWSDFDFDFDDVEPDDKVIRDVICVVGGEPQTKIEHNGATYHLITNTSFAEALEGKTPDAATLDKYSLNAGTSGRTIYLYATDADTITVNGSQVKLAPISGISACSGNAVPSKGDKTNEYGTWEEVLDTSSNIVDMNDSVMNLFDDFTHVRDCRLFLFAHRYDQSVKPGAQINRGEVKSEFTQGNIYLVE